ncbi:MAG TPA: hypothetical protein VIT92_06650 [Burkholderiaceae bacterium]
MLTLMQQAWWWLQHPACLVDCLKSSMADDGDSMMTSALADGCEH